MEPLNPSAIREIFKFAGLPGMISFAGGNPSEATFPAAELAEVSAKLFATASSQILQYGISEGYGPLRELTKKRLRDKFNIGGDNDEILLVTGGQQVIDLAMKTLTNEGDTVIVENPSFIGALNDIRSYKQNIVGVPMDHDGMDMDALERALCTEKNVKLIYTIPDFQNPMGVCMSLERRKRLYELAVRHDIVIVEDSPYYELRYYGTVLPAIKALDVTGHVVYCGSYSKTVAPGLRVGVGVLDKSMFQKFTVAKQCADVQTTNYPQMLIAEYISNYNFDAHVELCRTIYRVQRDLMVEGLSRNLVGLPESVKFTQPDGGLFIWVDLPKGKSGYDLFEQLVDRKLATVPGSTFDPTAWRDAPGIRLNFSMPSPEEIEKGTAIFGEVIKGFV